MAKKPKPKVKKQSRSRYIPKAIAGIVEAKHFFQCAWCCTGLMEKHHIKEFSEGGKNEVDNLILLCPNCHTEVHKKNGKIKLDDLRKRKSTHIQGDRLSGIVQFDIQTSKIKFGSLFIEDFETQLSFGGEPVIQLEYLNNGFYLSCRFYNKESELIFWMSKNRYWCPSSFSVKTEAKSIEITNKNPNYKLHIWQTDDYLNMIGENYRRGKTLSITSERILIDNVEKTINMQFSGNGGFKAGRSGLTFLNM